MRTFVLIIVLICFTLYQPAGLTCTRVVYKGPDNHIITARSMDWDNEIPPNLWIFPRNLKRHGNDGRLSVEWTSRYASVIASSWDIATSDGINEKGLVSNQLWLAQSEYPPYDSTTGTPSMAISAWAQFMLGNFATVRSAVEFFSTEPFTIVSNYIPGTEIYAALHLSISDTTRNHTIFEYIGGQLYIHHSSDYLAMTNSPAYGEQLARLTDLNPGHKKRKRTAITHFTDRFVNASSLINAIPKTSDTETALNAVFEVIRNCSIPLDNPDWAGPGLFYTRWRAIADQKHLMYYFETPFSDIFWVNLKKLDFNTLTQTLKFEVSEFQHYSGDISGQFTKTKPFTFAGI